MSWSGTEGTCPSRYVLGAETSLLTTGFGPMFNFALSSTLKAVQYSLLRAANSSAVLTVLAQYCAFRWTFPKVLLFKAEEGRALISPLYNFELLDALFGRRTPRLDWLCLRCLLLLVGLLGHRLLVLLYKISKVRKYSNQYCVVAFDTTKILTY